MAGSMLMLRCFPNFCVQRRCTRVDENSSVHHLKQLARDVCRCLERLHKRTCLCAETAFGSCIPNAPLCTTPDILKPAAELPAEHPGWRLLSVLVEHTGTNEWIQQGATDDLKRLTTRIKGGAFTTMRPCAVAVWLVCRVKMHVDPSEDLCFPAHWKQILKTDVCSPTLGLSTHAKSLFPGTIEMVFGARCQN